MTDQLPRRPCAPAARGLGSRVTAAAGARRAAVRSARGGGLLMSPGLGPTCARAPGRDGSPPSWSLASRCARRGFWPTCWSTRASSSNGSTARSPASLTARRRTTFWPSSSNGGYARAITPGALHRGRLFHVQYKPLYEAIGEPNNRNRKPASLGRFVERLMLLDAVLADTHYSWLGTERDKMNYFVAYLEKDMPKDWYPHLTFGEGREKTTRYFPGQAPDRHAARWRPAARVPLPGHAGGARRVPAVSPAPRRPAPGGRRMDDPPPRSSPIPKGRGALSLCRPGRVRDAADAARRSTSSSGSFERATGARLSPPPDPDLTSRRAPQKFGAARFRALHRRWESRGHAPPSGRPNPRSSATSCSADRGRVEFAELSHQYLQLTPLVGVA